MKETADAHKLRQMALYSVPNENYPVNSFVRTRGFKMAADEITTMLNTMRKRSRGASVRASGRLYQVIEADESHLMGTRKATGKKTRGHIQEVLGAVKNEHFIVLGVCLRNTNDECFACLREILDYASSQRNATMDA